ncbi:uncharacterized protein METZ01_LOCUS105090, partial [marine metagenome]
YTGKYEDLKFLFIIAIEVAIKNKGKVLSLSLDMMKYEKLIKELLFIHGRDENLYLYTKNPNIHSKLNYLNSFSISSGISDGWFQ